MPTDGMGSGPGVPAGDALARRASIPVARSVRGAARVAMQAVRRCRRVRFPAWLAPLRVSPGVERLRTHAAECEAHAPVVAASLRQQADSLALSHYQHCGHAVSPEDQARLLISGGQEPVSAIPEALRPRMAAELAAVADGLRAPHLRAVARTALGLGVPWDAVYGPGSYWQVAAWCRRVAAWLDPQYSTKVDQRAARAVGATAGAVTPVLIWCGMQGVSRLTVAAATQPWVWVLAGLFSLYRTRLMGVANEVLGWLAWEAPVRWPYAVDSLLRHTLPWWQGYASGWNTTRVLWEFMAPTEFSARTPIPRMERPESVADLNASLIEVGQHYSRFVDTYPVVNEAPHVVVRPEGPVTLATFIEMTDELMARPDVHGPDLSGVASAVRILYSRAQGRHRFVVLVPGTQTMSMVPTFNPYTMSQNLHLLAHGKASTSVAAQQALWRERRRLGIADSEAVEVLAYGHSQGGIIAAQIARDEAFTHRNRVTHVVTTGAPIAGREYPASTKFLALEHSEDVIPKLDLTDSPRESNVVTVQTSVRQHWSRVLDVHRWFVYRDTMNRVLRSNHPALRQFAAEAEAFCGPFECWADYPQHRELPAF